MFEVQQNSDSRVSARCEQAAILEVRPVEDSCLGLLLIKKRAELTARVWHGVLESGDALPGHARELCRTDSLAEDRLHQMAL